MTKTKWFTHDYDAKDDPKCMLLIDELGLEGYGIFWVLVETLRAAESLYRYPLKMLGGLARKYNTTAQKMEVVVRNYGLFQIQNDEFFFSESLLNRMLKYEEKKEQARIAAKIGAEKRRKKQEEQLKKLSGLNSSQRPLSDRKAITIQYNTIHDNTFKKTTTTNKNEFENWLDEKTKKSNVVDKSAYKYTLRKKYKEGESSVVEEFENWLDEKKREEEKERQRKEVEKIKKELLNKKIKIKNDKNENEIEREIVDIEKIDNDTFKIYTDVESVVVLNKELEKIKKGA